MPSPPISFRLAGRVVLAGGKPLVVVSIAGLPAPVPAPAATASLDGALVFADGATFALPDGADLALPADGAAVGTGGGAVTFAADWAADATKGGWLDRQTMAADRLVVDTALAAPGGKPAIRCTVKQGDDPIGAGGERSEVLQMHDSGGAAIYEAEAATPFYYAWAMRFPSGWAGSMDPSGDWSIVFQMHGPDQLRKPAPFMFQSGALAAGGAPVYKLKILAGDLVNKTGADIVDAAWIGAGADTVRAGIWSKFVAKIVFSKTAGELRVYRRDEDQTDWAEVITRLNAPTLQYSSVDSAAAFGQPLLPAGSIGRHYFKQGLYRGPTFARTDVYHFSGGTARANSFAAAEAAAF